MTKREKFDVIHNVFASIENEFKDEILEFCEAEKAALDAKNEKARIRASAKREKNDALCDVIEGILTDEPMTVNDILNEVEARTEEDMTPAKIVARMTKLVKAERAIKDTVRIEGRKLTAYTKA